MRNSTLLIFLIFVYFAAAQNGSIQLNWSNNNNFPYGSGFAQIPHFNPENIEYNSSEGRIYFISTFPSSRAFDVSTLRISNVNYQSISQNDLGWLNPENIPTSINAKLELRKSRDEYHAQLKFNPIIKENGQFKKVLSLTYSYDNNANFRRAADNNVIGQSNSILASGEWFRFYINQSGVYKISKSFLNSLGMNTSVDPRKIKIYGHGGKMAPLLNSELYPLDLAENPIQFIGEEDGSFDNQDYILFYAEGMDNWNPEYQSHNNIYADRTYYYVTSTGDLGQRIPVQNIQQTPTQSTNQFTDYLFYEKDLENIGKLGRRWMGERFNINNEQTFEFQIPGIITSEPVPLKVTIAGNSSNNTNFTISANNAQVGTLNLAGIQPHTYILGREATYTGNINASENIRIKLVFNNNGVPGAQGYLDYITLQPKRQLKAYGKQYRFTQNMANSLGVLQFNFNSANGISQVWDVTNIYDVKRFENTNGANFSYLSEMGENRKFVVVDDNDLYSPGKENNSRVVNQNIKGTIFKNAQGQPEDVDYLIVAPEFLMGQAERLAQFHRTNSQLSVRVLSLEKIYQEFSSGKQDIGAIRNLVKYIYFNPIDANRRIKYLNLFGDASFDFKNRTRNNTNIVPIYHALNSFNEGEVSFSTDDFFGMLDENEGRLDALTGGYQLGGIDVAVGRMIVSDVNQARQMVDKVIDYHDYQSYGAWRNNYVLIADDDDGSSDYQLVVNQENLSQALNTNKPFINVEKIFLDSYQQETAAGGERYPRARTDIFNNFEKGALVFNYLGHGGEDQLASERIWIKEDGQNLSNRFRYPLFITITCEFSRFDNPLRPTAGEYAYWNPTGGAISMVTTTRTIGQGGGQIFNARLSQYLFSYINGNPTDEYYSIADALRRAKNAGSNTSTNVVTLIGDPALYLAIPKPKIRLTKINDVPLSDSSEALQSLGRVKLSGEITDENNIPLTTYSGQVSVSVFDKPMERTTLNNDGNGNILNFSTLGETIFRGNATVSNGNFDVNFVVPRDIRVPLGNGRVSFYAKRNEILLDKSGFDSTIKVGGINIHAAEDNIGPTVKLYMNDQTFVSGGITNENPFFLAFLEDENGINTASGIGHDIIAILDGDETNPYILNDYYEADTDDFRKGKLRFPFRNLAKGLHTITFQAWDVYNNPIRAEIQFIVVGDDKLSLTNVLNYPNPFSTYTEFWFSHNKPYEPLDVQVQVMTVTGKVVWTRNQVVNTEGFLSREITWDGRDDFGDRIGKGVYIYKLTVRSTLSNTKAEKIEKLVIL